MKKLFLVRHAKSSWKDSSLADRDRPLNKRGQRDAPRMGRRLVERGVRPDVIITSPAVRARTTAELIASEIGHPGDGIRIAESLYLGGTAGILRLIRELDTTVNSAMLCGHNPDMTAMVNHLAQCDIANVPTCGIAEIHFSAASWDAAVEEGGQLVDFDYPKQTHD